MSDSVKTSRNSSIELLRLFAIWGIIMLHVAADIFGVVGANRAYIVGVISVCNAGVTIFFLISGYYGMNFSGKKLLSLELTTIFYSLVKYLSDAIYTNTWSKKDLLYALTPVCRNRFWFITVYMIIFILSPYINKIFEVFDKKQVKRLVVLMFIFFSLSCTIVGAEITGDTGKGVVNMLLVYLIGRYIRLYKDEKRNPLLMLLFAVISFGLGFLGNLYMSTKLGPSGWDCPLGKDSSATILVGAVFVFLAFKSMTFESKVINLVAKTVLGIYLSETVIRFYLVRFIVIRTYEASPFLFIALPLYALLVIVICAVVEGIRILTLKRLDGPIYVLVCKIISKFRKESK